MKIIFRAANHHRHKHYITNYNQIYLALTPSWRKPTAEKTYWCRMSMSLLTIFFLIAADEMLGADSIVTTIVHSCSLRKLRSASGRAHNARILFALFSHIAFAKQRTRPQYSKVVLVLSEHFNVVEVRLVNHSAAPFNSVCRSLWHGCRHRKCSSLFFTILPCHDGELQ